MSATPAIIIKRVKRGHGAGHHGGAWKVAYADFVTAMMALFIVLWLLNTDEKIQQAIGGYFRDPSGYGKQTGSASGGTGEDLTLETKDMNLLKEKIATALAKVPELQAALKDQVQMMVTSEGLRIELLETETGVFFDSGNAKPTVSAEKLLSTMAAELGKLPNRVVIEGHTDSRPFADKGIYSNWELSTDRANAARRLMQQAGVRRDQINYVRGFADQRLRLLDKPDDASNRRVSVVVQSGLPDPAPAAVEPAKPGKSQHGGETHAASKVDPKAATPKVDPKAPPKVDPKAATPKVDPKAPPKVDPKAATPKVDPKAPPKVDPKAAALKVDPKAPPRVDPKAATPKVDPKAPPKAAPKAATPKVDPKAPPKVAPKAVTPKVDPKAAPPKMAAKSGPGGAVKAAPKAAAN